MAPFLLMALENRSGITDSGVLAREEERISKKKGLGLFGGGILDGLGGYTSSLYQLLSPDILF